MKKAFKLFGFIAFSMTLAVACGNANNTPAEEEVVVEEAVEATEQVVEQVAAPATEATEEVVCDEKKNDVVKELANEAKGKIAAKANEKKEMVSVEAEKAKERIAEESKAKVEAKAKEAAKGGFKAVN